MAIRPSYVPPGVRTRLVRLTRQWSSWHAGDIMELEAAQAGRVIAKGYGEEYREPRRNSTQRQPKAETAVAPPPAETADVTPQAGKGAGKAGD